MEPKHILPHSQEPVTRIYSEPDESTAEYRNIYFRFLYA